MPTYLYECSTCGERFERFHGVNHVMDKHCPNFTPIKCKGEVSRKVNSTGTFLLKGEGWFTSEARDKYHETSKDKHRYVGGAPWE